MQLMDQKRIVRSFIALALALCAPLAEASVSRTGTIQIMHSPDSRPCFFFTLDGVPIADSTIHTTSPWFAIAQTAINYKEVVALVLFARANGVPITATTSGGGACGLAEVGSVEL